MAQVIVTSRCPCITSIRYAVQLQDGLVPVCTPIQLKMQNPLVLLGGCVRHLLPVADRAAVQTNTHAVVSVTGCLFHDIIPPTAPSVKFT